MVARLAKTSQTFEVWVKIKGLGSCATPFEPDHYIRKPVTGLMVPKMLLTNDEIIREIQLEARMFQRVHDHFKSQIMAGVTDIPNCRCLKAKELDWARRIQPVYDLAKFPDDPYDFEEDWIKVPGSLNDVREEFAVYALQMLATTPVKRLKSLTELAVGEEAHKEQIDRYWLRRPIQYDQDSLVAYEEGCERYGEKMKLRPRPKTPVKVIKPFVEYETFEPYAPHRCTEEELAEIARRREETLGMGTPSERAAREYLFDLIDAEPWAREALEAQAEDNDEAAKHLKWLFEQKAAQATNKRDKSESEATSVHGATSEQEEMIRQMYAVSVEGCDEPFFDIERSTPSLQPNCHPAGKVHCPMGKLIDI